MSPYARKVTHKYGAKPTTVDGIRFASQKEAKRYGELKLLEKAGEVKDVELQPSFDLLVIDGTEAGKLKRAKGRIIPLALVGTYRADFMYLEKGLSACENDRWHRVVEDVKGFKTPLYRWKKKHVEAQYGIEIREV